LSGILQTTSSQTGIFANKFDGKKVTVKLSTLASTQQSAEQ
jgi:hypothetical protein